MFEISDETKLLLAHPFAAASGFIEGYRHPQDKPREMPESMDPMAKAAKSYARRKGARIGMRNIEYDPY